MQGPQSNLSVVNLAPVGRISVLLLVAGSGFNS